MAKTSRYPRRFKQLSYQSIRAARASLCKAKHSSAESEFIATSLMVAMLSAFSAWVAICGRSRGHSRPMVCPHVVVLRRLPDGEAQSPTSPIHRSVFHCPRIRSSGRSSSICGRGASLACLPFIRKTAARTKPGSAGRSMPGWASSLECLTWWRSRTAKPTRWS